MKKHPSLFAISTLLLMGVIYALPGFMIDGIMFFPQEDAVFHLSRLIGLQNVWGSPVSFLNFGHSGLIMNLCYPWLTIYPMHLLYRLSGNYITSYKIYLLLLTEATLLISYYSMQRITNNHKSSWIFSVLYSFSAYRFANIWRRAALAEAISMTLLPLILLGLYEVFFRDQRRWKYLAFGMTSLAYSHYLSLFLASAMTGICWLASLPFQDQRKKRFLSLCKAAGAACLLSAGAILPMAEALWKNDLYTPGGSGQLLHDTAFSLKEILSNSLMNTPNAYGFGLSVLIILLCLTVINIARIFKWFHVERNIGETVFFLTGLVFLFASSSLFPWKTVGNIFPISSIEFAWRLNAYTTLLMLASFTIMLPRLIHSTHKLTVILICTAVLSIGLHYTSFYRLHREDSQRIFEADIEGGDAVSFDYAPIVAKQYRSEHGYDLDTVFINEDHRPVDFTVSNDGSIYEIEIDTASYEDPVTVDLPVFWYRSQICTVNGNPITTVLSPRGTTLFTLPGGEQNSVRITYRNSTLTCLAWAISAASAFLLIRFRRNQHINPIHK